MTVLPASCRSPPAGHLTMLTRRIQKSLALPCAANRMDLLLCSYFGLFMLFTSYLYRSRVRIREIVSYFFLQVSGSGASAGLAQGWPGATVSGTAAGGPGGGERGHLLPRGHTRMLSSRRPVSDSMRSAVSWLAENAVV